MISMKRATHNHKSLVGMKVIKTRKEGQEEARPPHPSHPGWDWNLAFTKKQAIHFGSGVPDISYCSLKGYTHGIGISVQGHTFSQLPKKKKEKREQEA